MFALTLFAVFFVIALAGVPHMYAIGSLVIPAMVQRGYSRAFAAALLSVAGTLALLMPLSIPFLVYAFISGVSMRQLSMAGVILAFICAGANRKNNLLPTSGRSAVAPRPRRAW